MFLFNGWAFQLACGWALARLIPYSLDATYIEQWSLIWLSLVCQPAHP